MNEWYSVNCITINTSSGAEKPFLNHTKLNLELLNVSIELQTVTINSPIAIASYDQQRGDEEQFSAEKYRSGRKPVPVLEDRQFICGVGLRPCKPHGG